MNMDCVDMGFFNWTCFVRLNITVMTMALSRGLQDPFFASIPFLSCFDDNIDYLTPIVKSFYAASPCSAELLLFLPRIHILEQHHEKEITTTVSCFF